MAHDQTIHNDVVSDISSPQRVRRGEVLVGIERRRKWPDETRIAIVAEALEPGIVVSHVARRHDLNPSQLFGWLKQYRADAMALRAARSATDLPTFVPAMLDLAAAQPEERTTSKATTASPEPATIEISIGTATVRIRGAADAKTLAVVLKALRSLV
jgi:transposase